jgi:ubiquinone/menaquinone biosynthesis C-methylase UbiE
LTADRWLELLRLEPSSRVLQVGLDDLTLSLALAGEVPLGMVLGLDPDDDRVREARRQAAAGGLDNVMFAAADSGEIPWKEDYFSHVVAPAPPAGAAAWVRECHRVLAPGGRLWIAEEAGSALSSAGFVAIERREALRLVTAVKERATTSAG